MAPILSPGQSEKLMRNVIEACIKENVYVIIDWHDHNLHEKEAIEFFSRMAADYGNNPHVIYEIFNEPDYETWPEVKSYSEKVIAAIREKDPDNIILLGTPRWDQDIHLAAADPVRGFSNLMYTMHFYAGTHKQWLRDRTDEAIKAGLPVWKQPEMVRLIIKNGRLLYNGWTAANSAGLPGRFQIKKKPVQSFCLLPDPVENGRVM